MLHVRASAKVAKAFACHLRQLQRLIEFTIDDQARITRDVITAKRQLDPDVTIAPQLALARFTHWVLWISTI